MQVLAQKRRRVGLELSPANQPSIVEHPAAHLSMGGEQTVTAFTSGTRKCRPASLVGAHSDSMHRWNALPIHEFLARGHLHRLHPLLRRCSQRQPANQKCHRKPAPHMNATIETSPIMLADARSI